MVHRSRAEGEPGIGTGVIRFALEREVGNGKKSV